MSKSWLIDTDVAVDYLRGLPQAAQCLEKLIQQDNCHLSVITVAELYAGVKEGREKTLLENFIHVFHIIALDESIAQLGGLYRRDYGKKQGVGLADALIAATSEQHHARLVTLNKKHFPMLKNIFVPYMKT